MDETQTEKQFTPEEHYRRGYALLEAGHGNDGFEHLMAGPEEAQAHVRWLEPEDVARIHLGMVDDAPVRLGSTAAIQVATSPSEVRRIDGRRGLRIRAGIEGQDLNAAASTIQELLQTLEAPAGVQSLLAGQAEEMTRSLQSLAVAAALALFLVYVVMASGFESLHHPFLIMFTVPLAFAGVVFASALLGHPISAMGAMGAIILGGIAVNNAIVLIAAVNQRRGNGMDVHSALVEAARVRVRPILMTTATTVLGLLPMAAGLGQGAALRQPLAVAVIGGLLVATPLTLFVVPCVYALLPGRTREAWRADPVTSGNTAGAAWDQGVGS